MLSFLRRALAAVDRDATAHRIRRIRDPATGRRRPVLATVGLWRLVDDTARDRGISPEALCQSALAAHPDLIPGEAVWRYLLDTTPKPE